MTDVSQQLVDLIQQLARDGVGVAAGQVGALGLELLQRVRSTIVDAVVGTGATKDVVEKAERGDIEAAKLLATELGAVLRRDQRREEQLTDLLRAFGGAIGDRTAVGYRTQFEASGTVVGSALGQSVVSARDIVGGNKG